MSRFDLNGRVALVTGSNGGLGLAMAKGLAEAGAAVLITGRSVEKNERAVDEIVAVGGRAGSMVADLLDETSGARLGGEAVSCFGRLDILVNNAGINIRKRPEEYTLAEWHTVLDSNLTSALPVLEGGLSRVETKRRRQDHQHRVDRLALRRLPLCCLRRKQGRSCAADEVAGGRLGR